jgi:hypothetical protein
MFDRHPTRKDLADLRDRIIARFNDKTGSNAHAHHAPLVDSILEELFPDATDDQVDHKEHGS